MSVMVMLSTCPCGCGSARILSICRLCAALRNRHGHIKCIVRLAPYHNEIAHLAHVIHAAEPLCVQLVCVAGEAEETKSHHGLLNM